jgi:hypothetical protein
LPRAPLTLTAVIMNGATLPSHPMRVPDYDFYASMAAYAAGHGWSRPGQGDLRARVEEYVLCRDGRWHRRDHLGYTHPDTTLTLLEGFEVEAGAWSAAAAAEAAAAEGGAAVASVSSVSSVDGGEAEEAGSGSSGDDDGSGSGADDGGGAGAGFGGGAFALPESGEVSVLIWAGVFAEVCACACEDGTSFLFLSSIVS